jgi:Fic-DOC domain mobile mystery protein B
MERINFVEYPPGATPLDPDEAEGLIPQHITLQSQLNEWEQVNILKAEQWIHQRSFGLKEIATAEFIKKLHQRMFSDTWRWAGQFRQTNKNIGVDKFSIPVELKLLLDDLCYQLQNKSYPIDELVARFHHRLVSIHPFANGNGRHARMMADLILRSQNGERFTWGEAISLTNSSTVRAQYINALRAADKKEYQLLMNFVRS